MYHMKKEIEAFKEVFVVRVGSVFVAFAGNSQAALSP